MIGGEESVTSQLPLDSHLNLYSPRKISNQSGKLSLTMVKAVSDFLLLRYKDVLANLSAIEICILTHICASFCSKHLSLHLRKFSLKHEMQKERERKLSP